MLHFEVELEVAYELSSRLHYLITLHYIRLPDFVFFPTWYVKLYYVTFDLHGTEDAMK